MSRMAIDRRGCYEQRYQSFALAMGRDQRGGRAGWRDSRRRREHCACHPRAWLLPRRSSRGVARPHRPGRNPRAVKRRARPHRARRRRAASGPLHAGSRERTFSARDRDCGRRRLAARRGSAANLWRRDGEHGDRHERPGAHGPQPPPIARDGVGAADLRNDGCSEAGSAYAREPDERAGATRAGTRQRRVEYFLCHPPLRRPTGFLWCHANGHAGGVSAPPRQASRSKSGMAWQASRRI
jgi:hypothetical protein